MKHFRLSKSGNYAEKMYKLMNEIQKHSLNKRNSQEINLFLNTAGMIEQFSFNLRPDTEEIHFKKITNNKIKSIKNITKHERYLLELTDRHFTINEIFFDLWSELGTGIRNCIIGDYRNVAKSLRWILESTVFWVNFQLDQRQANQIYDSYKLDDDLSKKDFIYQFNAIKLESRAKLEERIKIRYKIGRPPFGQLVNDLSKLNHNKTIKVDHIQTRLRDLHEVYSSLIHISTSSMTEFYSEFLRGDFAFFQSYEYDKDYFTTVMSHFWTCLDLVVSLIVLTNTYFFKYDSPKEFLEAISNYYADTWHLGFYQNKIYEKKLPILMSFVK